MKNLAQKRAAAAIAYRGRIPRGQGEGNVLSGFPMLVRVDGLLAALAFACETKDQNTLKHDSEHTICHAIVDHLRKERIVQADTPEGLARELASGDTTLLRRATFESLAFLNYLKRFGA